MLVPVGELDDDAHLWVHRARRANDKIARDFVHRFEAEVGPAHVAFGGDVGGRLRVGEEEIVEDDFVEELRRQFGDVFHVSAVFRLGVGEGRELAVVDVREANRAGDFDTLIGKELLHVGDQLRVGQLAAAICFEIDLVDVQLARSAPTTIPATGGLSSAV